MSRIKYDSELIKLMTLFESMTGAKVKDCISDEKLTFIIEEGDMGKAIGRNGATANHPHTVADGGVETFRERGFCKGGGKNRSKSGREPF